MRPPIMSRHQLQRLPPPRMPCHPRIVMLRHDPPPQIQVIRDEYLATEEEEPTLFRPFRSPECPSGRPPESLHRLSHGVFVYAPLNPLPDVPKNRGLFSRYVDALQGSDGEELRSEEGEVLVVLGRVSVIRATGKCIRFPHGPSGAMTESEVETSQVEGPSSLATIQLLGRPEILQILVVGPNLHRMLGSLQQMPPLLQRTNDSQHLLIVDLVVPLHLTQALRVERDRMPLSILLRLLGQDRSGCHVGTIRLHPERPIAIRKHQDWGRRYLGFQGLEGGLLRLRPPPRALLLGEVEQRTRVMREPL